jgi:phytanoyl-CoA hydroxylase
VQLTDQQIGDFSETGFTVVEGLLGLAEVDVLRSELDCFALGYYQLSSVEAPGIGGRPNDDHELKLERMAEDERLRAIQTVHFPHWVSTPCRELVERKDLLAAIGALAGAHLGTRVGEMTCIQSFVFYKHPGELGKAWHQDETYIQTDDGTLTGVWVALDDATVENGCLWFVPGSHGSRQLFPMEAHCRPDEFDYALEAQGCDTNAEVPVEVAAGDAVVFNGYLLHSSGPNRSSSWRRAIATHYMSSESEPRWNMPNDLLWPPASAGVTRRPILWSSGI